MVLKLISGFPPPQNYSEAPYGVGYTKLSSATGKSEESALPDFRELRSHDILAFNDYEKGFEYAKKVNKLIFLSPQKI